MADASPAGHSGQQQLAQPRLPLHVNQTAHYEEVVMGEDSDDEFVENINHDEAIVDHNAADQDVGHDVGLAGANASDDDTESDSDSDNNVPRWEKGDRPNPDSSFSGRRGLQIPLPADPTVIDFVQLFIDEAMYEEMTVETNRYARQYLSNRQLPAHSRFRKWPEQGVTTDEIECFMSLITAMGLVVHEYINDYWSNDPVMQTPFFSSVMPQDHFMNILSFFHLCDNDGYIPRGRDGYQPLYKLGNVYTTIIQRFQDVWYPGRHICIDEGMIPFRGKVHMRVYNPDKPDKYGLKSYEVCDSQNAYCYGFHMYTGKDGTPPSRNGKTYDLVMKLMQPYLHRGHTLFVDNYYTSPALFTDLYEAGTGATGTARNRRGMPEEVKNAKLKLKGDKVVMHNGPLMAMKFKDRKDVKVLSTVHSSTMVGTGKRDHHGNEIQLVVAVHEYNKFMGAVDRSDQMVGYSSFRRKTLKWWKKAFFHVQSLALLNAWIVYREWCTQQQQKTVLQGVFR